MGSKVLFFQDDNDDSRNTSWGASPTGEARNFVKFLLSRFFRGDDGDWLVFLALYAWRFQLVAHPALGPCCSLLTWGRSRPSEVRVVLWVTRVLGVAGRLTVGGIILSSDLVKSLEFFCLIFFRHDSFLLWHVFLSTFDLAVFYFSRHQTFCRLNETFLQHSDFWLPTISILTALTI